MKFSCYYIIVYFYFLSMFPSPSSLIHFFLSHFLFFKFLFLLSVSYFIYMTLIIHTIWYISFSNPLSSFFCIVCFTTIILIFLRSIHRQGALIKDWKSYFFGIMKPWFTFNWTTIVLVILQRSMLHCIVALQKDKSM